MPVTKLIVSSVMLASLFGASARGDAILTLGSYSSPNSSWTTPPANPFPSFNLATNQANSVTTTAPAPAPVPASTLPPFSFTPAAAVASAPAFVSTATPPSSNYDAFINFGTGSFLNGSSLTTGSGQAWYESSKIAGLFGGQPTAQQIAAFDNTVLQRVQQTFAIGGVPVKLTDNPSDSAAHMLSVVSNAVNPSMTSAIGMTDVGGNGFHFIDNSAPFAKSVDQLEWIVAHNVAHELMLAFGVPEVHDQTGHYIDSTVGSISMFLNPNATFSSGAVQDLLSQNFQNNTDASFSSQAQLVDPSPVPEPATLAAWALVVGGLIAARRARRVKT